MKRDLTHIEREVLAWLASRTACEALRAQLATAVVVEREHTGVGSYTDLAVPADAPRIPDRALEEVPVRGPMLRGEGIDMDALSLLWVEDGAITCLELAAFGEHFPEDCPAVELEEWQGES